MKRRIVSLLLVIVMFAVALPSIVLADTAEAIVTPAEGVAEAQEATPAEGVAEPQEPAPAEGVAEPQEAAPAGGVAEPQEPAPAEGVAEPQEAAPAEGVPEPQGDPSEGAYVYEPAEEVVDAEAALVAPTIKTVTYGNFEGQNPMVHVSCSDPDGHKVLEVYTLKEGYNEGDGMGKVVSDDGTKIYTIVGIQTLERGMENVWEDDDGNLHMKTEMYSGDKGELRPEAGEKVTITISGEVQDENGYHEEIAEGVDITVPPVGEIVDVEVTAPCTHPSTTLKYDANNHWDECNTCHAHLNESAHDPQYDWNADQHWKKCNCGYVDESTRENHKKSWKWDDEGHWEECACGYKDIEKTLHDPVDKVSEDGATTWKECVCGWKSNPVPRETSEPTTEPSAAPTEAPTTEPSAAPTEAPTTEPSAAPTEAPTTEPSAAPSDAPTTEPSAAPTSNNVVVTTPEPTPDNGGAVPLPEPTEKARKKSHPRKCKHTKYRYKYTIVDGEVHDCQCTNCGKQLGWEEHTFKTVQGKSGSTYEKCTKCNYVKCDHSGTAVWGYDDKGHWVWCSRCMTVFGTDEHSFDSGRLRFNGVIYEDAQFCRCGFTMVMIDGNFYVPDVDTGEMEPLEKVKSDLETDWFYRGGSLSDEDLAALLGGVAPKTTTDPGPAPEPNPNPNPEPNPNPDPDPNPNPDPGPAPAPGPGGGDPGPGGGDPGPGGGDPGPGGGDPGPGGGDPGPGGGDPGPGGGDPGPGGGDPGPGGGDPGPGGGDPGPGGGDPGPGGGDPGPGSGDSGGGGYVLLPSPSPSSAPTLPPTDDDGHEHIYGIPQTWGENLHIRHCIHPGCQYSLTQRHVFRKVEDIEPSDAHPNGAVLYHCPYCGYDLIVDNEEE